MQFIYTSSHGDKGITQLAICGGWTTYAKIRISKTNDSGRSLYFPNDPSMRYCQAMVPGHAVMGTNVWRKSHKPQKLVKKPFSPIHKHTLRYIIELQGDNILEGRIGILLSEGRWGEFLTTVNSMVGGILSPKQKGVSMSPRAPVGPSPPHSDPG